MKCNLDATLFSAQGLIGYRMVIRDHHDRVQVTREGRLHGVMDALSAEVMSCREALSWLKTNGFQRVSVESDTLLLVEAVNKNVEYRSPGWTDHEGLCKLDKGDSGVQFMFCLKVSEQSCALEIMQLTSSRSDIGDYATCCFLKCNSPGFY